MNTKEIAKAKKLIARLEDVDIDTVNSEETVDLVDQLHRNTAKFLRGLIE
jgi:hypothetical protein